MMRDLDDLLPFAMIYAPNCPEPLALRFLRQAARTFCDRTKLWRETDTMTVSTPDFEGLCTIADARIVAIEECRLDGHPLDPKTIGWLDDNRSGWSTDTELGSARYVAQMQPNSVTVVPRQTGTLTIRLVLEPSLTALQIPEFLIEDYGTEIGIGASAEILMMPNVDYANPQLGSKHESDFKAFLDKLSAKSRKGQVGARLRTTGRYF